MYCYEIGGVGFGFDTDNELLESPNYGMFRISEEEYNQLEHRHLYTFDGDFPTETGKIIFDGSSYIVCENGDYYYKISSRVDEISYKCALTEKKGESGGVLSFTEGGYDKLKTTAELFRLIDTMSDLLFYDGLMLHASYIDYNGRAILFSADPGTGKSTQADLWKKYAGAEILNGDRAILRLTDNGWLVHGNPACGSSDICVNKCVPLDTIAFLKQSPVNRVNDLPLFGKFMNLSAQLSCGVRKTDDTEKLLKLTEKLANDVRICELECTPDERAVRVLMDKIGGAVNA